MNNSALGHASRGQQRATFMNPVKINGPPFAKVLLACAGVSSVSIDNIVCSNLSSGRVDGKIHVKSIHLLGVKDPMMPRSKSVSDLFSEAQMYVKKDVFLRVCFI